MSAQLSGKTVKYTPGRYFLVESKNRVGKKIALRSTVDMSRTEISHRLYRPQKAWFTIPKPVPDAEGPAYRLNAHKYNRLDVPLIWRAFDVPENVTLLMNDKKLDGNVGQYTAESLEEAIYWLREARYWRAIGLTKPFSDDTTLRANAWRRHGTDTGTISFSRVMRDAVMDMERALKRKEQGLAPNYLWDKWGPLGFTDGSRADYLPRMPHNPYVDPDGVNVKVADIKTYTTHEQLKERYAEFINADEATYAGAFLMPSNGGVSIAEVADGSLVEYYVKLQLADGVPEAAIDLTNASDLRLLMHVAGSDALREQLAEAAKWSDIKAVVTDDMMAELNLKVDFARLLHNVRDDQTRLRRFYEEKCGLRDFMNTSDKVITGAVINCMQDIQRMVGTYDWALAMAEAHTELEWAAIMGEEAFELYRNVEESVLDKRRRTWATRFAGEANEEKALDYMLENFGRRSGKTSENAGLVNAEGGEYDREREPIGRNIQRRVLGSDKKQTKRRENRVITKRHDPLASLHTQQIQKSTNFGIH